MPLIGFYDKLGSSMSCYLMYEVFKKYAINSCLW